MSDFCKNPDIVGELVFHAHSVGPFLLKLSLNWQFANNINPGPTSILLDIVLLACWVNLVGCITTSLEKLLILK